MQDIILYCYICREKSARLRVKYSLFPVRVETGWVLAGDPAICCSLASLSFSYSRLSVPSQISSWHQISPDIRCYHDSTDFIYILMCTIFHSELNLKKNLKTTKYKVTVSIDSTSNLDINKGYLFQCCWQTV